MAASDLDITSDLYFVLKTCSRTFFPMPKQWDPTPLLGVVCSACASESGFNVRKRVRVCECVCKEVLNHESVCVHAKPVQERDSHRGAEVVVAAAAAAAAAPAAAALLLSVQAPATHALFKSPIIQTPARPQPQQLWAIFTHMHIM